MIKDVCFIIYSYFSPYEQYIANKHALFFTFKRPIVDKNLIVEAIKNHDLCVIKKHIFKHYHRNEIMNLLATYSNSIRLLRWARSNGCPWISDTCSIAAENGRLKVLKWLRANGCTWTSNTCFQAAQNGHFKVLQWAYENGCSWDSRIFYVAAYNGQLKILQWARANG